MNAQSMVLDRESFLQIADHDTSRTEPKRPQESASQFLIVRVLHNAALPPGGMKENCRGVKPNARAVGNCEYS